MKTYKYIHFVVIQEKGKTSVWSCRNNSTRYELGLVQWYGPWRQYCYFSSNPAVYSDGCLADIRDFISSVNITVADH